jgi:hypothetical protein
VPSDRRTSTLAAALVVAFLAATPARASEDEWTSGDKRAHFIGGLIVAGVVSRNSGSVGPGVLTGCGVGVFGELIQGARHGWSSPDASAKDFAAECVGGLVGGYIGVQIANDGRVQSARNRSTRDSWTAFDKVSHFAGGAVISGLAANYTESATAGLLTGCGVSAAGELVDAARYGWHSKHASAKDFAAGCMGAVAGAFIGVQVAPNRITWTRRF